MLDIAGKVQGARLSKQELRAERLGLATHGLGELGAARREDARVVHDLARDGDLPTKVILLHHEHPVPGTRKIDRRRKTGGTAADDDGVVELGDVDV